jgi:NifB/MoaA-like Fe-S oxidoreductase
MSDVVFAPLPNDAIGANTTEMASLSGMIPTALEQLEAALRTIDDKISRTTWSGKDAEDQARLWNQTRKKTKGDLETALNELKTKIVNQTREQNDASKM